VRRSVRECAVGQLPGPAQSKPRSLWQPPLASDAFPSLHRLGIFSPSVASVHVTCRDDAHGGSVRQSDHASPSAVTICSRCRPQVARPRFRCRSLQLLPANTTTTQRRRAPQGRDRSRPAPSSALRCLDRQETAGDPEKRVRATRPHKCPVPPPGKRGAASPSPGKPPQKPSCEIPLEKLDFGGAGE